MAGLPIESAAFRKAVLHSERLRILSLLAVVGFLALFAIGRDLIAPQRATPMSLYLYRVLPILGAFAAYEMLVLALIRRAIRTETEPPAGLWTINVFAETLLPTLLLLVAAFSPDPGPYRSLVLPVVLTYFIFIILATLRLSPGLCILTGVFSAAGYLAIVIITRLRFPVPPPDSGAFGLAIYITFAVLMLVGGLTAAAVTRQVRLHVIAALREAEACRQVEQMEHDLDIARSIQQGLLPHHTPSLNGFDIAGWSRPAQQTGGDYYDWQELPGGRLVVSLADVSGHGIGPALVTAVCRAYARASFLGEQELGRLVDRLHALLADDLPTSRFVTFAAVVLDERADQLQLVSAGHGPIFHYRAGSDLVDARNADGLPLGVMPDIPYAPARPLPFTAGDALILVTDGFFEWDNGQEQFGIDRLCETIRTAHAQPAAEIIERMHADVVAFTNGTRQADDLTAVVIKRL